MAWLNKIKKHFVDANARADAHRAQMRELQKHEIAYAFKAQISLDEYQMKHASEVFQATGPQLISAILEHEKNMPHDARELCAAKHREGRLKVLY